LTKNNINPQTKLYLSQALKYAIIKGFDIQSDKLVIIFKSTDDKEVKSEIIWCIGYVIK